EKVARRERDAAVGMAPRERAAGADVTRADRDLAIERELPKRHLRQQLERNRHLVDARHREALVSVDGEPRARFDVDQRGADLPARGGDDAVECRLEARQIATGASQTDGDDQRQKQMRQRTCGWSELASASAAQLVP